MLIQLFSPSDFRTLAEVAAHYRALGYRSETRCRRGIYYLKLWQDKPADAVESQPALPRISQAGS